MKNNGKPGWIWHYHLFNTTEYECPVCGSVYGMRYDCCPCCGIALLDESRTKDDWVEEAEELDWLLDKQQRAAGSDKSKRGSHTGLDYQ